ncbi:MAG: hypothetical protein H0V88_00210 [Pyrinomonadaceae bacterium]|nr:hypothetical protein [Pyrinomonadaceae bacterium]
MYEEIKLDECAIYRLPPLDSAPSANGKNGRLQTGVVRSVSLDPGENVRWFDLGARGRAALLGIVSTGAVAVRVHFADVQLTPGAQLFVRSLKNREEVYGPYEGRGVSADGSFWTPPVTGEGIVIEYFDPHQGTREETAAPPFRITEVSHEFRD